MANTLSCPIPSNLNPLTSTGFKFTIDKLPEISFFCQEANIPGITMGEPALSNPFRSIPLPGDHLTYDTLNVKFIVDADMSNYIALYNWIIALGFPESYSQYINYISANQTMVLSELAKSYSGAVLQVLNGTNTPVKELIFRDVVPRTIESLTFQSNTSDVNYIIGSATFQFSYYTFGSPS